MANVDQVMAGIGAWLDGFDFNRKGKDASLGKDIAMTIIRGPDVGAQGGIMGRCADGVTPDGQAWPENSPEYSEEKARLYGWDEVGRRTSQMLSQASLYGRTRIDAESIEMVYGTGQPPSGSAAPTGYLSKQDKATSDTVKATHAHDQGRGFYGFNAEDLANVIAVAQENLNEYIREHNGG